MRVQGQKVQKHIWEQKGLIEFKRILFRWIKDANAHLEPKGPSLSGLRCKDVFWNKRA